MRLKKKTPPRKSMCRYVCTSKLGHCSISEDEKGQPTPKRWKRLHVENLGHRPYKRCRHEFQQLNAEKRLRDVGPGGQTAKRLASRYSRKEAEGLPSSVCRLGVG